MRQLSYCSKMVFTADDKQLIKSSRHLKGYSSQRFLKEFSQENWMLRELDYLLSSIDKHGNAERVPGNGQQHTALTSGT